jgi:SAM-dependent methyltransferase
MSTLERTAASHAEAHWAAGRADEALRHAWTAFRAAPNTIEAKGMLAALIGEVPGQVGPEMRADVLSLLRDKDIAPEYLSVAGWLLVVREAWWTIAAGDSECARLAAGLERDTLALALLRETPVHYRDAERVLTRLRRWLLFSNSGNHYPRLVEALAAQADLNGGAWPFRDDEREKLAEVPAHPLFAAYLPLRPAATASRAAEFADPVTAAVAQGYESWPYPSWRRVMAVAAKQLLPDEIRRLDPGGPDCLPVNARILIAGCGTGKEAAQVTLKYPDAAITAIDMSEASLAYAKERWVALGLREIKFVRLDLHKVSELNERFDAIFCSGVLHHLPDPERGWAALAKVLRPGGVMRIMLYSKMAHTLGERAKMLARDLAAGPIDDDAVRAVRQRFLDNPPDELTRSVVDNSTFSTLGGTHDLLLHAREDFFDVPRIVRALERLRLRLLCFVPPTPGARVRYNVMFPQDRMYRDMRSLAIFERHNPMVFAGMYDFWCRSDAFWLAPSPSLGRR